MKKFGGEQEQQIDDWIANSQMTRLALRQMGEDLSSFDRKTEAELIRQAAEGRDKEARNRVAVSFALLVARTASRYHGGKAVNFDDFFQTGFEAVIRETEELEPGDAPPVYLRQAARRAMAEEAAHSLSLPYEILGLLGKLGYVWEELAQEYGRYPSVAELAARLQESISPRRHIKVTEELVVLLLPKLNGAPVCSLREETMGDNPIARWEEEADEQTMRGDLAMILQEEAAGGSPEYAAAELVFGLNGHEPVTQWEAAEILGIGQTTVSARARRFCGQLQKKLC